MKTDFCRLDELLFRLESGMLDNVEAPVITGLGETPTVRLFAATTRHTHKQQISTPLSCYAYNQQYNSAQH